MVTKRMLINTGLVLLFLLTALPAISNTNEINVPVELKNKISGVRIDDIVSTNPSLVPGLANLAAAINKSPERFFNQSAIEVVRDVFFQKMPVMNGAIVKLELIGFVRYKKDVLNFEKITVTYNSNAKKADDFFAQTDAIYPIKDMVFKVSVGLVDRKLIITDTLKDIKIVFPIGVGSFDEGVMNEGQVSIITPRFKNGFIDQRAVISKREKPRYYRGLPFIRILKGNDLVSDHTPIGFHIEINQGFVRGFDSHGCMRLREMDLMAFHDLIVFGDEQQIPITVDYNTVDTADHPATKKNRSYKTILNKGTAESPFFIYDRDNLVQTSMKEGVDAPIGKLIDQAKDNYHELFNYETSEQIVEQNVRRKNECDAKVMSGELSADEKKYEACLEEGKRKDSMKDRIYRKYMGIDNYMSFPTGHVTSDLF